VIAPARAAAIRTLYVQARTSALAAAVVTVYMVATAWPYNSLATIGGWLVIQLGSQLARALLLRAFAKREPADEELEVWARRYTLYMLGAGLIWGVAAILFIHPATPITVALTLCGLYGLCGGSISGNAYNPAGQVAFTLAIFGCVDARLFATGQTPFFVLAVASSAFAGILVLFTRVQAKAVLEGFDIRFENVALVAALEARSAEAQEARARAEQANRVKSQFLAAASHDLRQPLHALSLYSASLRGRVFDAEAGRMVDGIQSNIDAMEGLFEGLLDVSRLEAGTITPVLGPVSVTALFDRLFQVFGPSAAQSGTDLRLRPIDRWVRTDGALLEQVLSNLIGNALRYAAGGSVMVATRVRGDAILFEVRDNGPGVALADQARIFEDFVQLGNAERDRRKGLGLGLAIARRAADLIDADLRIRSEPGRGAVFDLRQPLAAAPDRPPIAAPVFAADAASSLRVLIVDDEPEIRAGLTALLGGWGAKVEVVASAREALDLLTRDARFGAILTDQRLPEQLQGLDLILSLRDTLDPPIPCGLITGDMDPGLLAACQRHGVPLLHKPVKAAALRALLNHLAAHARQTVEAE
jgi:signal transduction histidine kinase/ActR/RegA family two-component response regulator